MSVAHRPSALSQEEVQSLQVDLDKTLQPLLQKYPELDSLGIFFSWRVPTNAHGILVVNKSIEHVQTDSAKNTGLTVEQLFNLLRSSGHMSLVLQRALEVSVNEAFLYADKALETAENVLKGVKEQAENSKPTRDISTSDQLDTLINTEN
jgi:hypothetical protein